MNYGTIKQDTDLHEQWVFSDGKEGKRLVYMHENIIGHDFSHTRLDRAIFQNCLFFGVKFDSTPLTNADFSGTILRYVTFHKVDLSGVTGLPSASEFIAKLEHTDEGVIAYKAFGSTRFSPPKYWNLKRGEYLTEVVNANRTESCGCGVNVANSLKWCIKEFGCDVVIWKVLIEWKDLADVVVPYETDGKFRAGRVKLLDIVTFE